MDNIRSIENKVKPPQLYHNNRFNGYRFCGSRPAKVSVMELKLWKKFRAKVLDDTFTTDLGGESRDFVRVVPTLLCWTGFTH
jgi:HAE1 family hydrophobic/amphiphilic exporter-1/multidrug efflux pump